MACHGVDRALPGAAHVRGMGSARRRSRPPPSFALLSTDVHMTAYVPKAAHVDGAVDHNDALTIHLPFAAFSANRSERREAVQHWRDAGASSVRPEQGLAHALGLSRRVKKYDWMDTCGQAEKTPTAERTAPSRPPSALEDCKQSLASKLDRIFNQSGRENPDAVVLFVAITRHHLCMRLAKMVAGSATPSAARLRIVFTPEYHTDSSSASAVIVTLRPVSETPNDCLQDLLRYVSPQGHDSADSSPLQSTSSRREKAKPRTAYQAADAMFEQVERMVKDSRVCEDQSADTLRFQLALFNKLAQVYATPSSGFSGPGFSASVDFSKLPLWVFLGVRQRWAQTQTTARRQGSQNTSAKTQTKAESDGSALVTYLLDPPVPPRGQGLMLASDRPTDGPDEVLVVALAAACTVDKRLTPVRLLSSLQPPKHYRKGNDGRRAPLSLLTKKSVQSVDVQFRNPVSHAVDALLQDFKVPARKVRAKGDTQTYTCHGQAIQSEAAFLQVA